jgi:two-component system, cell cycle sensor histidine kinase and response regulator CckA
MAVSGGEEAVEYLRDNTAALLLIDMVMEQGMNGYETYRKILELHPEQKAVITSGNAESDPIEKTLSLGAGSFISKPFSSDELGVAVRNELKPESDDLV